MRPHRSVLREIEDLTSTLIECGLADDSNPAYEVSDGCEHVRFTNQVMSAAVLKNVPYESLYAEHRESRAYNVLLLDGALIQMNYRFCNDELEWHRLAFLPSPDLAEFQNWPELYEEELLYADVIDKRVVTSPLRFDFDTAAADGLTHPASHLTIGQYRHCRVPVAAGLTPHCFIDFILRSFYGAASDAAEVDLPSPRLRFGECISAEERDVLHVVLPQST